jgi:hypothetical protein
MEVNVSAIGAIVVKIMSSSKGAYREEREGRKGREVNNVSAFPAFSYISAFNHSSPP